MRNIKPIKPDDVQDKKNEAIPDGVIEAVNEAIVANWNGSCASFTQDEIINRIRAKIDVARGDIFIRGWLDFEDIFCAEGWTVHYDGYGRENFPASFTFSKGKSKSRD